MENIESHDERFWPRSACLTRQQVGSLLNASQQDVVIATENGILKAHKIGQVTFYKRAEVGAAMVRNFRPPVVEPGS